MTRLEEEGGASDFVASNALGIEKTWWKVRGADYIYAQFSVTSFVHHATSMFSIRDYCTTATIGTLTLHRIWITLFNKICMVNPIRRKLKWGWISTWSLTSRVKEKTLHFRHFRRGEGTLLLLYLNRCAELGGIM